MEAICARLAAAGVSLDENVLREVGKLCTGAGRVTVGWPRSEPGGIFDKRLIFWPSELPLSPLKSIVSSRIGRQLDSKDEVFRLLRIVCARGAKQNDVFLTVDGTTTAKFVRRGCHWFGASFLSMHLPRPRVSVTAWAQGLLELGPTSGNEFHCFVSPLLVDHERAIPSRSEMPRRLCSRTMSLCFIYGPTAT